MGVRARAAAVTAVSTYPSLSALQGGNTALIWAVCNGNTACVALLVEAGAALDTKGPVSIICSNSARHSLGMWWVRRWGAEGASAALQGGGVCIPTTMAGPFQRIVRPIYF